MLDDFLNRLKVSEIDLKALKEKFIEYWNDKNLSLAENIVNLTHHIIHDIDKAIHNHSNNEDEEDIWPEEVIKREEFKHFFSWINYLDSLEKDILYRTINTKNDKARTLTYYNTRYAEILKIENIHNFILSLNEYLITRFSNFWIEEEITKAFLDWISDDNSLPDKLKLLAYITLINTTFSESFLVHLWRLELNKDINRVHYKWRYINPFKMIMWNLDQFTWNNFFHQVEIQVNNEDKKHIIPNRL